MEQKKTEQWTLELADPTLSKQYSDFKCVICLSLAWNPVQTGCCHHILCQGCWDTQKAIKRQCPYCRNMKPKIQSLSLANALAMRLLSSVKIKCPLSGELCKWADEYSTAEIHIKHNCLDKWIACENCNKQIKRGEQKQHDETCENRLVKCIHCGNLLHFPQLITHQASQCEQMEYTCKELFNVYGCDKSGKRKELLQHQKDECKNAPAYCKYRDHGCCVLNLTRSTIVSHLENPEMIKQHLDLLFQHLERIKTENTKKQEWLDSFFHKPIVEGMLVDAFYGGLESKNRGWLETVILYVDRSTPPTFLVECLETQKRLHISDFRRLAPFHFMTRETTCAKDFLKHKSIQEKYVSINTLCFASEPGKCLDWVDYTKMEQEYHTTTPSSLGQKRTRPTTTSTFFRFPTSTTTTNNNNHHYFSSSGDDCTWSDDDETDSDSE